MDDSLQSYIAFISSRNPPAFAAWKSRTEEEFVDAVERALDSYIRQVEDGAREFRMLSEPGLSGLIAKLFISGGISAGPEENVRGHVDLVIHHPADIPFRVLGECKIWDGPEWHLKGCDQLLRRYMTGRESRSFCLDFFKGPEMYKKLEALKRKLNEEKPLRQTRDVEPHFILGAFVTEHEHSSGRQVMLLHLGCNLHVEE